MLDMTKYTVANETLDNTISVNGASYVISDALAADIMGMIESGLNSNSAIPATKTATKTATKYNYSDHDVNYEIAKVTAIDADNKNKGIYIIRLADTRVSRSLRRAVNKHITSIDNIRTIKYTIGDKDYTGYGFTTKKAAENAMNTLPTTITAKEVENAWK